MPGQNYHQIQFPVEQINQYFFFFGGGEGGSDVKNRKKE